MVLANSGTYAHLSRINNTILVCIEGGLAVLKVEALIQDKVRVASAQGQDKA